MAIDTSMHLDLQDMLVNYFKQLHFNKMSANVRAKFDEHVEKDDLVGHMKDWKNNLWVKDGEKDPVETLKGISDDELIELYKDIRARLQRLNKRRELGKGGELDDKHPAVGFLNEYFGEDNMFHESVLDSNVKDILQLIKDPILKNVIEFEIDKNKGSDRYISYSDLIDGLNEEKFDKDSGFRAKLADLINKLFYDLSYSASFNSLSDKQREAITKLASVRDNLDPNPSKFEIDSFRAELPEILNQVYSKKKLRDTVFAGSEITTALDTARNEVDYDKADSECFVEGKTDDELTVMQLLKKEITDKYEDYLGKYFHPDDQFGDHLYKSLEAKEILLAIKKAGIKKTDGLDKVLEKATDIKSKAVGKMKKAGPQFDWIVKEFTKLKKDMPNAFAGCLNNGFQLSRIIQQLIMDAVDQDKMDEAKTAMELLVVMQYGNTTSGLMEKIRGDKELFTLFSNKDLSWNKKSEAVAFVTGALDKTFRIGTLAIGYGLTFVYNNVRQLGSRIKEDDGNKFFKSARDEWANHNADKERMEAGLDRAKSRIKTYRDEVGLTGSGIRSKKDKEDFLRAKEGTLTVERESIRAKFLTPASLRITLDNLENKIIYGLIGTVPDDIIDLGQNYINEVRVALDNDVPIDSLPRIPGELLLNPETKPYFIGLQNKFNYDKQNHEDFNNKQDEINRFNSATDELKRAEAQRDRYKKQIKDFDADKKNKFDNLVKYWNDLLRDSRILGEQRNLIGSAKTAQKVYLEQLKSRAA